MNKLTANPSGKLLADDSRQLRLAQQGRLRRFFGNYWFLLLCMAVPALLMYLIYVLLLMHLHIQQLLELCLVWFLLLQLKKTLLHFL